MNSATSSGHKSIEYKRSFLDRYNSQNTQSFKQFCIENIVPVNTARDWALHSV